MLSLFRSFSLVLSISLPFDCYHLLGSHKAMLVNAYTCSGGSTLPGHNYRLADELLTKLVLFAGSEYVVFIV